MWAINKQEFHSQRVGLQDVSAKVPRVLVLFNRTFRVAPSLIYSSLQMESCDTDMPHCGVILHPCETQLILSKPEFGVTSDSDRRAFELLNEVLTLRNVGSRRKVGVFAASTLTSTSTSVSAATSTSTSVSTAARCLSHVSYLQSWNGLRPELEGPEL